MIKQEADYAGFWGLYQDHLPQCWRPSLSAPKTLLGNHTKLPKGFPCGSAGKESAFNAEDLGLIPGWAWRSPGEGKGHPLHYSGLENSIDCIVHGVAKSQTRLSDFHFLTLRLWGSLGSLDMPQRKLCVCILSHFSRVWLFGTTWTACHQATLSMDFSRPEYGSGLPCLPPGDLPNPGIKPRSPAFQADTILTTGEAH